MAEFERLHAGNSEVQEKQGIAFGFAQTATVGLVATGVLTGLTVGQTATASGSVVIAAGAGVIGSTVGAGVSEAINPGAVTLDVFTLNPVGGLPRNDIIVWDSATRLLAVVVGTPNATPSDPTVANTKLPLARLRHAASTTTIPIAKIDDIRPLTAPVGTPIMVRNATERNALAAYDGLQVYRLDTHVVEIYTGASWDAARVRQHAEFTASVAGVPSGTLWGTTLLTIDAAASSTPAIATGASDNVTVASAGVYAVSFYGTFNVALAGRSFLNIYVGTLNVAQSSLAPGENGINVSIPNLACAAGTVIGFACFQSLGSSVNMTTRVRITKISS